MSTMFRSRRKLVRTPRGGNGACTDGCTISAAYIASSLPAGSVVAAAVAPGSCHESPSVRRSFHDQSTSTVLTRGTFLAPTKPEHHQQPAPPPIPAQYSQHRLMKFFMFLLFCSYNWAGGEFLTKINNQSHQEFTYYWLAAAAAAAAAAHDDVLLFMVLTRFLIIHVQNGICSSTISGGCSTSLVQEVLTYLLYLSHQPMNGIEGSKVAQLLRD